MAKIRVPYRRLADQFHKAAQDKGTPSEWRHLGHLVDRNFEEIENASADDTTGSSAHLLVMSATGDSIANGADYVAFSSIVAQHQFTSVSAPGASWIHPIDGVYFLEYEHAWSGGYIGGGTIRLEVGGTLVPEGRIASGSVGQEGRGSIIYTATAGSVGRIKVTQSSGAAQTCDAVVRVGITDPAKANVKLSVVSISVWSAPGSPWPALPTDWGDTAAHWIWHHALVGTDRPNEERSWLVGEYTAAAAVAVTIEASVDNSATVHLNGAYLGAVNEYTQPRSVFSATLVAGVNKFAIAGHNGTAEVPPNPAGVILSVKETATGTVLFRTTDAGGWWGMASQPSGWPTP